MNADDIKKSFDPLTLIEYMEFGNGDKNLILLPGLSAVPVCNSAQIIAQRYEVLAKHFHIILLDRPARLASSQYNIKDAAKDVLSILTRLGIEHISVLGNSQGGMIAMQLASDYPEMIDSLILCATTCKTQEQTKNVISSWINASEKGDKDELARLYLEDIFSPVYAKAVRSAIKESMSSISKDMLERFAILAKSCLEFDLSDVISNIKCKTLVLGCRGDKVTLPEGAVTISKLIQHSQLIMYENEYGHNFLDEVPDILNTILYFLES